MDKFVVLERLIPGAGSVALFRQHEARYQFAGGFVRGKRVLDIACGCGIGTSYLMRAGAQSCFGMDISQEAASYATSHFSGPGFAVGDALNLPVEDESIDVIVSFETIEHIADSARFVDECCRVLVPGGIFIGSTPHDPVYRWLHPEDNSFHLRDFSASELASVLSTRFGDLQLYAQSLVRYPSAVAKQLCVRLLNLPGLTEPILRILGKTDLVTESTACEFSFPDGSIGIEPYHLSWMWQPTLAVAVGTKPGSRP